MKRNLNGRLVIPLAGAVQAAAPKRPPFNPRTLPQQTQRGYLAATSAHWRELTDEARDAWCELGRRLPEPRSGHQAYVKVNVTLVRGGLPQVDLPLAMPAFGALNCAALAVDSSPQIKLLQVSSLFGADRLIVEATAPLSAGIQNVQRSFRELTVVPGPTPVPVDVDLTAVYLARFGLPRPGRRIFLRLRAMSNGFKGPSLPLSVLVAN